MLASLVYSDGEGQGDDSLSSFADAVAGSCSQPVVNRCASIEGCLSRTMSRADRWRRKQIEDELSLSQYTTNSLSSPTPSRIADSQEAIDGDADGRLMQHTPSSGLLCHSPALCRRRSNLFANMISPESVIHSPQLIGNFSFCLIGDGVWAVLCCLLSANPCAKAHRFHSLRRPYSVALRSEVFVSLIEYIHTVILFYSIGLDGI